MALETIEQNKQTFAPVQMPAMTEPMPQAYKPSTQPEAPPVKPPAVQEAAQEKAEPMQQAMSAYEDESKVLIPEIKPEVESPIIPAAVKTPSPFEGIKKTEKANDEMNERRIYELQKQIHEAENALEAAASDMDRGIAQKRLVELNREKNQIELALPYSREDRLNYLVDQLTQHVNRYRKIVPLRKRNEQEEAEYHALSHDIPVMQEKIGYIQTELLRAGKEVVVNRDLPAEEEIGWFKRYFKRK